MLMGKCSSSIFLIFMILKIKFSRVILFKLQFFIQKSINSLDNFILLSMLFKISVLILFSLPKFFRILFQRAMKSSTLEYHLMKHMIIKLFHLLYKRYFDLSN